MCGIIGYVGSRDAAAIILEGLFKLEYRGYDSAGLAVFGSDGLQLVKQKGRLSALEAELARAPVSGNMGIGHTRWATHGEPSDVNSHPHIGEQSKIVIVHNGIIENYRQLKERLVNQGVNFASQTDSEVIAQLAEHYYDGDLLGTVIRVAAALEGSYALGIMCVDDPDTLIAVKKDSPLIVGQSDHGNFIASDVPAILNHTNQVYYLDDREIAVLTRDSIAFYNIEGESIEKQVETISWTLDSAEKGGYQHFMLKEIMEQPRVLRDTIQSMLVAGENKELIESLDISAFNRVVITACGSAYNAGVVGKYVFERLCRFSVEVELASEFRYKDAIIDEKTLVILISQSGETADTIAAMREAKRKGATTLSICNVVGSTVAKESDYCIYTLAGPEIAVATTKAFSAQLAVLYVLALRFANKLGMLDTDASQALLDEVATLPELVETILQQLAEVQMYASTSVAYKSIFFIGRNIDYAISLEGSLKLKEISYIHSEAYAGGELKHGTISLIEDSTLVVALANCPSLYEKIMSNVEQVISREAKVLLIGNAPGFPDEPRLTAIRLPEINELFSPSLAVIIMQLFAYYVAANKGADIDKPRNLAKSVTVE
jgi:glucosamine--fructose-6-phosphate aminotransferase (isomerizing)